MAESQSDPRPKQSLIFGFSASVLFWQKERFIEYLILFTILQLICSSKAGLGLS
jgi:hypothetical protein